MARASEPKYQIIARELRERIESGSAAPGEQLASQQTLAAEFGVTIMTLRQALAELERAGLVRTAAGKGTYVADAPSVSFGLDHLSSFAQEMSRQGADLRTEVLSVGAAGDGPVAAAARAELAVAGPLVAVVRRRSIDGLAVVVQTSTLARSLWEQVADVDLDATSLYDALADRAGVRVERADETFRAVLLGPIDAAALGAPEGAAGLESTRVSCSSDGPFLVDRALMLGAATEVRAVRTAGALQLDYGAT